MRRLRVMFMLAALGCGSSRAPPASQPAPAPVVAVPDAPDEEATAEESLTVADGSAPPDADGSLAECVRALRASPNLAGSPAESEAYARALAFEQSNDLINARKAYYEIFTRTPNSPYVPLVYLAFGEMFARDATGDASRWQLARQAYRATLKYPPPQNPAWAYTALQVAEIDRTLNDSAQALNGFVKVVSAVRARPDTGCAGLLLIDARRGAVLAYADAGVPDRAYQLFRRYDAEQSDAWLADLVDEYVKRGKRADACAAAGAVVEVQKRAGCP